MSEATKRQPGTDLVGASEVMVELLKTLDRVAATDASVLILGESGTGKERLARRLHALSPRVENSFVVCDCSALPPSLIESELFGHTKGAFTGASTERMGLFREADGGTILLDEIAELELPMQSKLLRVLQEGQLRPVGSDEQVEVDVRLVAATNKPLKQMVARGEFRQDLYYRLAVVPFNVPPLRKRMEDLAALAAAILSRAGGSATDLTDDALDTLRGYHWPGNIRELENVLTRAAILCPNDAISPNDLPSFEEGFEDDTSIGAISARIRSGQPLKELVEESVRLIEIEAIRTALIRARWSATEAAKLLGISRASIYNKMARYGIDRRGD